LARLKAVWVGIEDPDPTVDRKGIKFLQDHGVAVTMFDRDLQEEIQRANRLFIAEARQRASEARQGKAQGIKALSSLEAAQLGTALSDLSTEALQR